MDASDVTGLIAAGGNAEASLAKLKQASRQLELPIPIDRKLQELLDANLDATEVLAELARFLSGTGDHR